MLSKETEQRIKDLMKRYSSTRDEVLALCVAQWWIRTVGTKKTRKEVKP